MDICFFSNQFFLHLTRLYSAYFMKLHHSYTLMSIKMLKKNVISLMLNGIYLHTKWVRFYQMQLFRNQLYEFEMCIYQVLIKTERNSCFNLVGDFLIWQFHIQFISREWNVIIIHFKWWIGLHFRNNDYDLLVEYNTSSQ